MTFFFFKTYLFLAALGLHCCVGFCFSLVAGSGGCSSCSVWASHCSSFSCCRAQPLGAWASVVVAHGLSCSTACGIPVQGPNPCPLNWQRGILNHWTTGESHSFVTVSLCSIISFTRFSYPPRSAAMFVLFMSHFIFVFRYYTFYCVYIGWAKKFMQVFL